MHRDEIAVYKSGLPWEAEMVAEALKDAGIPHYRRVDSLGLGEMAMPALPAAGLGQLFLIIVPRKVEADAQSVIQSLPVTPAEEQDQGAWTFRPAPRVKRGYQIYVWISLMILAAGILYNAIMTLMKL